MKYVTCRVGSVVKHFTSAENVMVLVDIEGSTKINWQEY